MKQNYILLRDSNYLLESLIGKSFNEKSKFEAGKILDEIHSKAQSRFISKRALCFILDKNEIISVGGSTLIKDKKTGEIVSNLILDQCGIWLASLFKKTDGSIVAMPLIKDTGGANRNFFSYGNNTARPWNNSGLGSLGMQLRIGSSSTTPTRLDFKIASPFVTAPESLVFNAVTNPVWNSGLGNFKYIASITAGGSGTINESILLGNWLDNSDTVRKLALFRDIISPASSFVIGQSIALEYTIQL